MNIFKCFVSKDSFLNNNQAADSISGISLMLMSILTLLFSTYPASVNNAEMNFFILMTFIILIVAIGVFWVLSRIKIFKDISTSKLVGLVSSILIFICYLLNQFTPTSVREILFMLHNAFYIFFVIALLRLSFTEKAPSKTKIILPFFVLLNLMLRFDVANLFYSIFQYRIGKLFVIFGCISSFLCILLLLFTKDDDKNQMLNENSDEGQTNTKKSNILYLLLLLSSIFIFVSHELTINTIDRYLFRLVNIDGSHDSYLTSMVISCCIYMSLKCLGFLLSTLIIFKFNVKKNLLVLLTASFLFNIVGMLIIDISDITSFIFILFYSFFLLISFFLEVYLVLVNTRYSYKNFFIPIILVTFVAGIEQIFRFIYHDISYLSIIFIIIAFILLVPYLGTKKNVMEMFHPKNPKIMVDNQVNEDDSDDDY